MTWWVNIILGFLIGSFMATYIPAYRDGFKAMLDRISKGKKKSKPKKDK